MNRQFVYSGILGGGVLCGLFLAQSYSFLLFHSLAEGFSIVIACAIFMLAWNTRPYMESNYLLFVGISYLFIGGLDLVHTLIYRGMGVFPGYGANPPTQLWIAARYMESISLALAPFWIGRKLPAKWVFWVYAAIFTVLLAAVFQGKLFPDCYIEGKGLTPFKIYSEYTICLILLAALAFLVKNRRHFDPAVLRLLILSIILTVASELAFTFYVSVYGFSNQIGHYLKIVSFFLIYKAIIQTGLRRPYDLMFRELTQSRENLQAAHDLLEQRVQARTAELLVATQQLQAEITERKGAQEALRKANRMLQMLSACNQCLVRATDEKAFLDTICRNIIQYSGYRFAWVGVAEQNQGQSLRPVAKAGDDGGLLEESKMIMAGSAAPDHPIDSAFRTGRPTLLKDLQSVRNLMAWDAVAAKSGFASAAILPLQKNGETLGALMIYADQPDAFDAQQIEWLMELAKDAAFGIATLRMHQRRKAVEAERRLLASAIEQAGECIAIVDGNATIEYINPAVECITGLGPPSWIGRPLTEVLAENHSASVDTILHSIRTGQSWSGQIKSRAMASAVLDLNIALSPIRDPSQQINRFVAIIQDITRECQMEQQLFQSQKMEAIGTLAGGIAHDFNNILSAINGFTELALDEVEKNTIIHENLNEVLKAGKRAKELVLQILAFSRQTIPECKPVIMKHIVLEAAKLLRSSLPVTIEIHQNLNTDAMVMADPSQIHQIVMNLGTNAAHAMREKGGLLEFALSDETVDADFAARYPEIQPGAYLKLTVSDTGHGMPQEIMNHIFEPFFTTKANNEGTGMGLAVVHGIVRGCGGMIIVSSKPDKGSSFSIFLPSVVHVAESQAIDRHPIPMGRQEHILFIDDEPSLVQLGRRLLESLGYRVTTRTDSCEALNLIKAQPDRFDLVLTDMTMPKLTGDKLAQEILAIRPKLPVILCSGFSTQIDERKVATMGIRAYIRKPVLREQLARIIRQVLENEAPATSSAENPSRDALTESRGAALV